MTTERALDLALETLESIQAAYPCETVGKRITAIKQARALDKKAENARELGLDYEPVQEPVAWAHKEGLEKINDFDASIYARGGFDDAVPLYTTPPAQPAPVQEPVAWVCYGAPGKRDIDFEEADINKLPIGTQLYTTPPAAKREWTGLTDEEIKSLEKLAIDPVDANNWGVFNRERFAELIEAKLKEKNT
jgi:hypothetical protein